MSSLGITNKWQRVGYRKHEWEAPRHRRRPHTGWVPLKQLFREIGEAHRRWLAGREIKGSVVVKHRVTGRPRNPAITACVEAWNAMGADARGFRAHCEKHGVNYFSALKRLKDSKPASRVAA
jgi:hypothetical protein